MLRDLPRFLVGASLLIYGCGKEDKDSDIPTKKKEDETVSRMGDVLVVGDKAFLLRNNKLYPIPNLEIYKRNTKFEQYGRRLFSLLTNEFQEYQLGEVSNLPTIIDPFSGGLKTNKPMGGEINVYLGGFMTDGGEIYDVIQPEDDMFINLRRVLKSKGWDPLLDSLFFTYGEKSEDRGFAQYQAKHTMRDPKKNIVHSLNFFQTLKERFPLCQFNLFGHSLGAIFAMEIAKRHSDAINNVILINGPVRGIEQTEEKKRLIPALKAYTFLRYGEMERVTDYLIELWNNNRHQREIDEFVSEFTGFGRKLTVVIDENDLIVPPESAYLEEAAIIRIPRIPEKKNVVIDIGKLGEARKAHGRPLEFEAMIEKVSEQLGYDLADAA